MPFKRCCICGDEIDGWGNNPYPVVEDDGWDNVCCDKCNEEKVIPARIKMMYNK